MMCIAIGLKNGILKKISSLITVCTSCFGFLAWFIAGQVIRWKTSGWICSEQPKNVKGLLISSGMFIQTWTIIMYALCCCAVTVGLVLRMRKN